MSEPDGLLPFNYCPKCGVRLSEHAKFCHGCGHALTRQTAITPSAVSTPVRSLEHARGQVSRCAHCGAPSLQKVSLTWASGTNVTGGTVVGSVAGHFAGGGFVSSSQTVLAARLAPPGAPGRVWLIILAVTLMGAFAVMMTHQTPLRVAPVVALLSAFLFLAWSSRLTNVAQWRAEMADWNERWICMACATVWDPPILQDASDEETRPAKALVAVGIVAIGVAAFLWLHNQDIAATSGTRQATPAPSSPTVTKASPTPSPEPPAATAFIPDQRAALARAYRTAPVTALRAALDAYRNATDAGLGRPEVWEHLDQVPSSYLASRFVLLGVDESPLGGRDVLLLFRDQPDRVFEAWMYEQPDGWVLRAFRQRQDLQERLPELQQRLTDLLGDPDLSG